MNLRRALIAFVLLLALAACSAAAAPRPPVDDPVAEGERLFRIWCSGCHTVTPDSPAGIGPGLAGVAELAAANPDGLSAETWLRRETVDPNAMLTPGYSAGLMPTNYEQILRPDQIDALVAYLLTLE